jgi:ankyrin repeat protein
MNAPRTNQNPPLMASPAVVALREERRRVYDALYFAACEGNLAIVSSLLAGGRVSPAANSHQIIIAAAFSGQAAIVKALLADGRADPAAHGSLALVDAAWYGHTGVVVALLADGRADPAAQGSKALTNATRRGYIDVVAALLADGRADTAAAMATHCHGNVTKRMLQCSQRWRRRRHWLRAGAVRANAIA